MMAALETCRPFAQFAGTAQVKGLRFSATLGNIRPSPQASTCPGRVGDCGLDLQDRPEVIPDYIGKPSTVTMLYLLTSTEIEAALYQFAAAFSTRP
jgi:hypothetical protein